MVDPVIRAFAAVGSFFQLIELELKTVANANDDAPSNVSPCKQSAPPSAIKNENVNTLNHTEFG